MVTTVPSITILGSSGGAAKAVLSILNRSIQDINDPIHCHTCCCHLHLIDRNQKDMEYYLHWLPELQGKITLYQFDVNDTRRLLHHFKHTKTNMVIDVSWADTIGTLQCCNKLGIHYVNTALENTSVDDNMDAERFSLLERYRLFEEYKPKFRNASAIIGSGMNPGVVQWMAVNMIKDNISETPLGCYIIEHDNSFLSDKSLASNNTIYTTWSPECFLEEAAMNYPVFVRQHTPLFLYKEVYSQEFKVSLGKKQFYGCLVPHEEVLTLGKLFDMEFGFIYKINEHSTRLIRKNIRNLDILWERPMEVLDPACSELSGQDLVGVLLVYDNKERYVYNVLRNKEVFARYHINATYFQVACGIYGAISTILLDDIPPGAYYVDELILKTSSRYGEYLSYHMKDFVTGQNHFSDGLLFNRIKTPHL